VFPGLINQAKSAAAHLVLRYVARASVAIPFVIAAGFALAAIAAMLVERFGHVTAYWLVGGGLGLIGVIASFVVSVKEHEEEVAEQEAAKTDTQEAVSEATAQALVQTPIALLGAFMTMPGGAAGALGAARLLGRNWPLGCAACRDRRVILAHQGCCRRWRHGGRQAIRLGSHAQHDAALEYLGPLCEQCIRFGNREPALSG
jgi:hypothetical protein